MPEPSSSPIGVNVGPSPTDVPTVDHLAATVPHPEAPVDAPPLPAVPGFEILRELGRGGMGVVYLARQESLKRLVALKMIRSGAYADTIERQRFRLEAEAVARLGHPGIVQVHQVGEHEGMPFQVLEYVPGGPLSRYLAGQPQPPGLTAAWVAALADAVAHAHDHGVVHRDLKPANVLLAAELAPSSAPGPHQLKVSDFGLAKALTGAVRDEPPTVTGAVLGTPSYMAPEQAEGKSQEVGPAADIYALGAILYELLTGRPPFRADSALNTLRQVVGSEPAPPRALNPGVPRDLEVVCLKCLRKEPARRYGSARELAEDLGRYRRGEPVHARPVGALERGWRLARRNPVVTTLTVLVFLSLVLGLAFSVHYAGRASVEADAARGQATRAEAAVEKESRALYLTEMNLAARSYRDGEVGVVRQLLAKWLPGSDGTDRRGPEWSLLQRQATGALRVLNTDVVDAYALGWSPDGQGIFSRRGRKFGARDAITGQAVFETELPPMTATLAVRPDGQQVAAAVWDHQLLLIDAATGRQTKGPVLGGPIRAVTYRPDGRELLTGCSDNCVRRHDVTTGAVLQTLPRAPIGHYAFVIGAGYVPGGNDIVSLDVYRWLIRWSPATGKPVWKLQTETGSVGKALAVHPHRPLAALGFSVSSRHAPEYGYIELRELEHGALVNSLECSGGIEGLAFNPEGNLLAAACLDGIVRVWDVRREQLVTELAGHDGLAAAVAWHPDGWRLASTGDRTLRLAAACTSALERSWYASAIGCVLHPRGESVLLLGGVPAGVRVPLDGPLQKVPIPDLSGPVHGGDWSADGRWVALAVQNHTEIRDGATLHLQHRLAEGPFAMTALRFSPDGERLVSHDGNGQVCIWETATGKLVRSWKGAASRGELAMAPDGQRVAVLNQSVALFHLDTGQKLWEKAPKRVGWYTALDFLADGRLVVGCDEGEVLLFAAQPRAEPVRTLRSRSQSVAGLRAVGDGRRLFSQDREGAITIWDVESAEVLRALPAEIASGPVVLDSAGRWMVRRIGERWALWNLRPLDEGLARQQEAFALVDHLAGHSVDRADLLRRVRAHPAIAADVREEALALAGRYDEDAAALAWDVFETACEGDHSAAAYAEQLPRADRAVRELPDAPVARLARAALRLRLDRAGAAEDLTAAEGRLAAGASAERSWLLRLRALKAAKNKRFAEVWALTTQADAMLLVGVDWRGQSLKMEALSLVPRQP